MANTFLFCWWYCLLVLECSLLFSISAVSTQFFCNLGLGNWSQYRYEKDIWWIWPFSDGVWMNSLVMECLGWWTYSILWTSSLYSYSMTDSQLKHHEKLKPCKNILLKLNNNPIILHIIVCLYIVYCNGYLVL